MRQVIAAVALLALNVAGAGAQEPETNKDYAVGPAAYIQCSTLNYTAPDSEPDNLYYAWATGYLTALNSGRLLMHGTMRHLNQSAEWQKAWLSSYCREHPDHSYGIAVFYHPGRLGDRRGLWIYNKTIEQRHETGLSHWFCLLGQ
jgi:hypothetical protein